MSDTPTEPTKVAEPRAAADEFAAMLRGDQRLRWLQGSRVPVEAYFEHYPELRSRADAVRELILGEIHLRRELGETLILSDFQTRFPDFAPWLSEQFARLQPAAVTESSRADDLDMAETPWPNLPGYEILQEIGRGGMGIVYKARQARLNRFVALKVLLRGVDAGPRIRARFRAEAEAVAQLQHPYIVQLFDILEHDDQLYLSLEYVGGGSLSRKIGGQPQPIEWSAQTIRTLAQAVQYSHERGIVHRDLKPSNVLLTPDGIPKIVDFGLAKRIDDDSRTTKTGTVMGTPDYMAPEQADGRVHDVGRATDIYALGVMLYELLTGKPPFRGEAMVRVLDAVRVKKPQPLRGIRPEIPRDLETICLRCLEKQPVNRYASAADLAADLGRFLTGAPIESSGRWTRLRNWFRRRSE
jgi:serine/threonine-protein kinase